MVRGTLISYSDVVFREDLETPFSIQIMEYVMD